MTFLRNLLSNRARNLANQAKRNGDDLSDIIEGGVDITADYSIIFNRVLDVLISKSSGF